MRIFGIKIDNYSQNSIQRRCLQKLKSLKTKPLFIVTLNPEILLTARQNNPYIKIINSAGIRLIDGFGIRFVSWLKRKPTSARITGADLARFLMTLTDKLNLKIGIIFLREGWSSRAKIQESLNNFKKLKLIEISKGEEQNFDFKLLKDCQLILVATGHPHQEILIYKYLLKSTEARIIMGIGGTLDFWTKRKIRAPRIVRAIGLEWLWRLIIQPNRLPRIFNAVVKFPIMALSEILPKIKQKYE